MKTGMYGRRGSFPHLAVLVLWALFWAVLAAGEVETAVRFAVIGDSGTGDRHQLQIARQMVNWHDRFPFSFTLMLGDNLYGGFLGLGKGDQGDFRKKFDLPYAELLKRGVIFRAALGNHDKAEDLIAAKERFHIEGEWGYYSFTAGLTTSSEALPDFASSQSGRGRPLLEFFVFNTNRLKDGDPQQVAWLKQEIENSQAVWKIAYGHHPPFSTENRIGHGPNEDLQKLLHPLFAGLSTVPQAPDRQARAAVQVVFSGHDHIYERFHPRDAVVYFICGSSGKLDRRSVKHTPEVAAAMDESRAFMIWEATSEELVFRAIDELGVAFDCGRITPGSQVEAIECVTPAAASQ